MTFVCKCEWNKLNKNYEQGVLAGPVFWRGGAGGGGGRCVWLGGGRGAWGHDLIMDLIWCLKVVFFPLQHTCVQCTLHGLEIPNGISMTSFSFIIIIIIIVVILTVTCLELCVVGSKNYFMFCFLKVRVGEVLPM